MIQTPSIDHLGSIAITSAAGMGQAGARYSVLVHSGAGLVAIVFVLVSSVVKPRGLRGWAGSRTN